jgi:hypothetical protein
MKGLDTALHESDPIRRRATHTNCTVIRSMVEFVSSTNQKRSKHVVVIRIVRPESDQRYDDRTFYCTHGQTSDRSDQSFREAM